MTDATLEVLAKRVEVLEAKVDELERSRVVTWVLFTGVLVVGALALVFRLAGVW